jgi:uncharacterized membrane protein YbhN (UPF0104 family)
MSESGHEEILKRISPARIILPVIIGVGVVAWLMVREINTEALNELNFTWRSVFWLGVALCCMAGRDLGYIIRIRILSENDLTWKQSFRIIMLWEFTSAVTPSTVGGTAVAVVFLNREGISVGRSTSIVLATSFLDELYFVIMFPLILLFVGTDVLFTTEIDGSGNSLLNNLFFISIAGYLLILAWVLFVGYGLFINPNGIKKTIILIFRLPFLRRWQKKAELAGDDIVNSSHELRIKPPGFWIRASVATVLSWSSRYWVVNAIITAFFAVGDHFLIFARQLVTWIMMIISPTPGGSGFAEVILGRYISDTLPVDKAHAISIALAMAVIWRIISYYPYLLVGATILPSWLERKFARKVAIKK